MGYLLGKSIQANKKLVMLLFSYIMHASNTGSRDTGFPHDDGHFT
jgi:hypothetical protein